MVKKSFVQGLMTAVFIVLSTLVVMSADVVETPWIPNSDGSITEVQIGSTAYPMPEAFEVASK